MKTLSKILVLLLVLTLAIITKAEGKDCQGLLKATREGETEQVKEYLDQGCIINT